MHFAARSSDSSENVCIQGIVLPIGPDALAGVNGQGVLFRTIRTCSRNLNILKQPLLRPRALHAFAGVRAGASQQAKVRQGMEHWAVAAFHNWKYDVRAPRLTTLSGPDKTLQKTYKTFRESPL